jgi:hypothetical protein
MHTKLKFGLVEYHSMMKWILHESPEAWFFLLYKDIGSILISIQLFRSDIIKIFVIYTLNWCL